MAEFFTLQHDIWCGGLKLDALEGFSKDFLLGSGEPVAKSYPKKSATYTVDDRDVTKPGPERPGKAGKTKASTTLTDSLASPDGALVVSERLRALLAKAEKKVEFLPVKIAGHKEPYFIANLYDHVACLDEKKSKLKKTTAGRVVGVVRLAVRENAIPKTRALFRVKEHADVILVRAALAKALQAAAATGLEIGDLAKYKAG